MSLLSILPLKELMSKISLILEEFASLLLVLLEITMTFYRAIIITAIP